MQPGHSVLTRTQQDLQPDSMAPCMYKACTRHGLMLHAQGLAVLSMIMEEGAEVSCREGIDGASECGHAWDAAINAQVSLMTHSEQEEFSGRKAAFLREQAEAKSSQRPLFAHQSQRPSLPLGKLRNLLSCTGLQLYKKPSGRPYHV